MIVRKSTIESTDLPQQYLLPGHYLSQKREDIKRLLQSSPQTLVLLMSHDEAKLLKDAVQGRGGLIRWRIDTHRSLVWFSDSAKDWKALNSVTTVGPSRKLLHTWPFAEPAKFATVVFCSSFSGSLVFWFLLSHEPYCEFVASLHHILRRRLLVVVTECAITAAISCLAIASAVINILGTALVSASDSLKALAGAFQTLIKCIQAEVKRKVRNRMQFVLDSMVLWLERGEFSFHHLTPN